MPNFYFSFWAFCIITVLQKYPCRVQGPGKIFALQAPTVLEQGGWSGGFKLKGAGWADRCRVNAVQALRTSKNRDKVGVKEKRDYGKKLNQLCHLARHCMGSITHKPGSTRQAGFCSCPMQNLCNWSGGCFWCVLLMAFRLVWMDPWAGASVWRCQPSWRPGAEHISGNKAFP